MPITPKTGSLFHADSHFLGFGSRSSIRQVSLHGIGKGLPADKKTCHPCARFGPCLLVIGMLLLVVKTPLRRALLLRSWLLWPRAMRQPCCASASA